MRFLVVRLSAIGDCVMAAHAVSSLRRAHPKADIVWAVQEKCAPVVASPGLADEVIVVPRERWKQGRRSPAAWFDQVRFYLGMRSREFDVGFDFQGHSKSALLARFARCKEVRANRATDALARTLLRPVPLPEGIVHEVEKGFALVEPWSLNDGLGPIMPAVTEGREERLVTIQTGAGEARKAYPSAQWAEVGRALASKGFRVVYLGAPGDPEPEGAESLVGRLSLLESTSWVARSALHIAADTGTGHVAAAYGTPVVSVFGPTDPDRFRPYGTAVRIVRAETPGEVPPAEIVAEAESLAGSLSARPR
ncbi:MAG: glycosyltransferase family 9 protein [Fimbriimonadaceae bacterium]